MSVEYLELLGSPDIDLLQRYFERTRLCESAAARDYASALSIQRRWRGYRDRKYIQYLTTQSTHIQRIFRGYLGRLRFASALRQRSLAQSLSLYSSMAIKIQKIIRGYLSRKFAQDVYARRAYIENVGERGELLTAACEENYSRQLLETEEETTQKNAEKFEKYTTNIHHLIGTKAIPSVFKSTLGPEFDATVYDIPVEEHIKDAFINRQILARKQREQARKQQASAQQSQQSSQQFSQFQQPNYSRPSISNPYITSPSPPISSTQSAQGGRVSSTGGSRQSRPTSGGRLAPIGQDQSSSYNTTQLRSAPPAASSSSADRSTSSTSVSSSASFSKPADTASTQKLPSLRSLGVGTPSTGRTMNAADFHSSKLGGMQSPDIEEEEKQQVPLALALGGHVSTTPTHGGRIKPDIPGGFGRQNSNMASTMKASQNNGITSPNRKWTQPLPPQIQRTEG